MPDRYAYINSDSHVVENAIMLTAEEAASFGADGHHAGYYVIQSDSANIADVYDANNGSFTTSE